MRGVIRGWAIGTMLMLTACSGDRGEIYYTTVATARNELLQAGVPLIVFGGRPELAYDRAQVGQDVVWQVREGVKPILQYVAAFERIDDEQILVKLTLVGMTADMTRLLEAKGPLADLYRTAMEEKIAATLDHRIFIRENLKGVSAVPGLAQQMAGVQFQIEEGGKCPPIDKAECEQHGGLSLPGH